MRNIPHPLIATPGPSYRGVMWPPLDQLTKDGYDLQWGTNVVGHFYFTELLMPALLAGVKTSPDKHARVITTSSSGAYLDIIHFDTFKDGPERKKIPGHSKWPRTQEHYVQVSVGGASWQRMCFMWLGSVSRGTGPRSVLHVSNLIGFLCRGSHVAGSCTAVCGLGMLGVTYRCLPR